MQNQDFWSDYIKWPNEINKRSISSTIYFRTLFSYITTPKLVGPVIFFINWTCGPAGIWQGQLKIKATEPVIQLEVFSFSHTGYKYLD